MYKVIAADLDGTLALSKSPMEKDMAEVLSSWLSKRSFAVISGGEFLQMKEQIIRKLPLETNLKNLYFFPTNGATCFAYDEHEWKQLYKDELNDEEEKKIFKAIKQAMQESKILIPMTFGEQIQNRRGQITLSVLGQNAPLSKKIDWDPDQKLRKLIVFHLKPLIPEFTISIAGTTSIDVTKKDIDKAYALMKLKEILGLTAEDILFLGDALFEGGNDWSAKKAGVDCIKVESPNETLEIITKELCQYFDQEDLPE